MSSQQRITRALTFKVAPLSFGKLVAIVSGLVTLTAATAGAARWVNGFETKEHAAATYVRQDSVALWRQRDSLNLKANVEALQKDVSALVRACQRKGECP